MSTSHLPKLILGKLSLIHDWLTLASRGISAAALMLIVVSFCYEVVARYFFYAPTSWSQEVVSYAFCVSIFTMLPYLTREKLHVSVPILLNALPAGAHFWASKLIFFAGFVVCTFAAWVGLGECIRQYTRNVFIPGIHSISQWWLTAIIVYGFFSSALYFFRDVASRETTSHNDQGVL